MRNQTGKKATRKGVVVVMAIIFMVGFAVVLALGIDTSRMVTTKTDMQNTADAAALAAANELIGSVHASKDDGGIVINENSTAVARARDVAFEIAELNGFWIDKQNDVLFGRRSYDPVSDTWPVTWGSAPYNVVRVHVRKDNSDLSKPDAELPLAFGWALGRPSVPIEARAAAFVQARDMVLVLDFSTSMNDDSSIRARYDFSMTEVEANLEAMWQALRDADPKYRGTSTSKFPSSGFGRMTSGRGYYYYPGSDSYRVWRAVQHLNLDDRVNGQAKYPFPQAGSYSDGQEKYKPSASTSESRWYYYCKHVIDKSRNGSYPSYYRYRFGYHTLMDYLQESRTRKYMSEDLWRTPHYPFHAVKEGATLFTQFISTIDYGDRLGLVSYATSSRWEDWHRDGDGTIDIEDNPISEEYEMVNQIQRRKQAGEYSSTTGMGYGIREATQMLLGDEGAEPFNGHARVGALPIMIVMTDGQANVYPSGWSLPSGFSWNTWTDYDEDGYANYSTSSRSKQYAFYMATRAVQRGARIHTMSVGAGSDSYLMKAIAHAGGGVWINIPGGSSVEDMEEQLLDAFAEIASNLPPANLIYDFEALEGEVD